MLRTTPVNAYRHWRVFDIFCFQEAILLSLAKKPSRLTTTYPRGSLLYFTGFDLKMIIAPGICLELGFFTLYVSLLKTKMNTASCIVLTII